MKKNIVSTFLALGLATGIGLTALTSNTVKDKISVTFNRVNTSTKYKSWSLNVTDPYFTGEKVIREGFSYYDQSILYNNILAGNNKMENIWEEYTGQGVTIAVIDTGLDINHPDFQTNVSPLSASFYTRYNESFTEYHVYKEVGTQHLMHDRVYDEDYHEYYLESHGTNTAGTACAEMNGVDTVGVAPGATLLALKVDLDDYSINEAIKYAADNGAKVINMSFGGYAERYYDHRLQEWCSDDAYAEGADTSMIEALNYAHGKDVILVAAAGNECTSTHSYPACNDYVIGVGALAINSSTIKADYSNYNLDKDTPKTNPSVDISAPGTVVVPECEYDKRSSSGKSTYMINQGTSFSSPVVAGMAALWLEKNPNGTPKQFEDALFNSAKDIGTPGWDTTFGYGSAQIDRLLNYESTVEEIRATSIKFAKSSVSVAVNNTIEMPATVEPANATNKVAYTSSDNTIAYVSNDGVITGAKKGTATITAVIDGLSATLEVKVGSDIDWIDYMDGFASFCGGNVVTTSAMLSLIALIGIALILNKKKTNS